MKKFLGEFYKGLDGKEYFYFPMLKSIYHIPKQDLARFNAFRQRLVIAVAIGAMIYSFFPENILLSCLSVILFYALSTFAYFKSVLPKYLVKKQVSMEEFEAKVSVSKTVSIEKFLSISIIGIGIILCSFFIGQDSLNRLIVIVFGIVVTMSGTYSLFGSKSS